MSPATDLELVSGIEPDPAVRPQDDFDRHVNGRWSETYVLPVHRAEATMLSLLAAKVQDDLVGIVRRAATEPPAAGDVSGRRIADLYASFMNEELIEARGAAALRSDLDAIGSALDPESLARVLGVLQRQGIAGGAELSVAADTEQARDYVLELSQGGLGLPAAALYHDPRHERLRERYAAHLRAMLDLAGLPDPDATAAAALRAETDLAAGHTAPDAAGRIPGKAACLRAAELAARAHGFPWAAWLDGLGEIPAGAVVHVRPAPFLTALERWWASRDLDALKAWMTWRHIHEMAPFGHGAVFTENFRFYGQVLTGSRRPRPRWMRATSFVQTIVGAAIGERYLREHLAPGTLKAAEGLVSALVRTYRRRLERVTWMSADTRAAALAKLDEMRFEIGVPSDANAPADLRADPDDLIGNVKRGRAWHLARQLARLGGPIDRSEWKVPPQAVTAYYRHGLNHVVIPAALLQPPVFDPDGDAARNFALLGSIVCHEMSHAFDGRGSRYDGQGRLREWWTAEDRAEFTRRTALLVEQYDERGADGTDGPRVSGARTAGENIADIVGLIVARAAFAEHLTAHGVPDAEQVAELRRFFMLWASMWRAIRTPGRMRERLENDRHAPPRMRCNGALGHVAAFYDAFGVTAADGMYIPPTARFTLL